MTQHIPLARLSHVFRIADYLQQVGFSATSLMDRHCIPQRCERRQGGFVTSFSAARFIKDATYQTGIYDCMLKAGLHGRTYGFYAKEINSVGSYTTLKEYLHSLCSNMVKESSYVQVSMRYENSLDGKVNIVLVISDSSQSRIPQTELYTLGILLGAVREYLGWPFKPARVYLQENHVGKDVINVNFEDGQVYYDAKFTGFEVPLPLLGSRPANGKPHEIIYNGEECPSREFVDSLRQLMKSYVGMNIFTVGMAAEHSFMSVRTLQRKLAARETNFKRLYNQARFEVSRTLLLETDLPVADIAHDVGYADPTCFTHFFRTLTGMSPRAFRKEGRLQEVVRADPPQGALTQERSL
ncbi:helix-turn-helix transcriptional regulator [Oceanidesulfovibrio marinus]|uniref:Helix-turn-helix transcriptional regulator n=1 Tax=Oceanidesulfovibrio marinus TaxID=370038 RepID=A0ABX6NF05_9BACT|nr:helix-turn-helix transcriptional regulator [Oceanidesulfovibrio marinus]QJT08724.1 helix-turn-helix transcriptional regulator [Oceanidesulfovibrio marinus]